MAMSLNKEIERIKSNISNLSEDEFFEILKECGFGIILPTEKIFEQLDVRKIVHAKWIKMENDMCYWYACSHCGHDVPENRHHNDWFSDWCPNCGSRMYMENELNE